MVVVSKEVEWMTHSWIRAAHNFPGTVSGTEDAKMDRTWNLVLRGIWYLEKG